MRRNERGFFLLCAYEILVGAMLMVAIDLTRTVTETRASQQSLVLHQADHLAEAGLDAALAGPLQGPFNQGQIDALIGTQLFSPPQTLPGGTYSVSVQQDAANQADALVKLVATGTSGGRSRTLNIVVELPTVAPGPFNYVVAATTINISGNSALMGSSANRVPIYINGTTVGSGGKTVYPFETVTSDTIWAVQVDFLNPGNLSTVDQLCRHCTNAAVFPVVPPPAPVFNLHAPPVPAPVLDLHPYYQEAIQECTTAGNTQADCEAGTPWTINHITTDRTIDGGTGTPALLEGVIYVEAGVTLTFKGNVIVHGTIVHEGTGLVWTNSGTRKAVNPNLPGACSSGCSLSMQPGYIKLASGTILSIDSNSTWYYNPMLHPFAPGLAIIGGAILDWPNNSTLANPGSYPSFNGINGFVMAGNFSGLDESRMAATGTIQGGLIGVESAVNSYVNSAANNNTTVVDHTTAYPYLVPGPTYYSYLPPDPNVATYGLSYMNIPGSASLQFKPLPSTSPGFPSGAGSGGNGLQKPTIRMWSD